MSLAGKEMSNSFTKTKVKTNLQHNRREYEEDDLPKNIHKDRMYLNNHMINKDAREEYKRIFNDSLEEYNNKQKRNDRKIKDYYSHVNGLRDRNRYEEMIIGLGNKDDWEGATAEDWETGVEIVEKFVNVFTENNPNMHVISADVHGDEDSPHAHVVFIPEGTGYERGLSKQVSFGKALENQGYGKGRAFAGWREDNIEKIEEVLVEYGVKRKKVGNMGFRSQEDYIADKEARKVSVGKAKAEIDEYREEQVAIIDEKQEEFNNDVMFERKRLEKDKEELEEERNQMYKDLEQEKSILAKDRVSVDERSETYEKIMDNNLKEVAEEKRRLGLVVSQFVVAPVYKKAIDNFVTTGKTGLKYKNVDKSVDYKTIMKELDKAPIKDDRTIDTALKDLEDDELEL